MNLACLTPSFPAEKSAATPATIPTGVKWAFTAFMAVLVPAYWANYGPTNFLYFCDAALFLALFAVWTNNALAASMAAVGILIPQFVWCLDFGCELCGFHLTGMTGYMFDGQKSLFLRGLSFFHGWLPFLLLFLLKRLGYDKRALLAWTAMAWGLCLVAFFCLPAAGAVVADHNTPRNVDYVFGMSDDVPQHWLPEGLYVTVWMLALAAVFYVPTHLVLKRIFRASPAAR